MYRYGCIYVCICSVRRANQCLGRDVLGQVHKGILMEPPSPLTCASLAIAAASVLSGLWPTASRHRSVEVPLEPSHETCSCDSELRHIIEKTIEVDWWRNLAALLALVIALLLLILVGVCAAFNILCRCCCRLAERSAPVARSGPPTRVEALPSSSRIPSSNLLAALAAAEVRR